MIVPRAGRPPGSRSRHSGIGNDLGLGRPPGPPPTGHRRGKLLYGHHCSRPDLAYPGRNSSKTSRKRARTSNCDNTATPPSQTR